MKQYGLYHTCPKCASTTAPRVNWHARRSTYVLNDNCFRIGGIEVENGMVAEHMHRRCDRCGYEWAEAPLSVA